MTVRSLIARAAAWEELNFLLTNRIPRRLATRFVGWWSRIEHPWIARPTIALWRLFCDVDLGDAAERDFASMQACFTRRLRPGARSFAGAPDALASPCDAILGAHGTVAAGQAYQIKGAPYRLAELLGDERQAAALEGARYATLRLTAGMYHRFHAPADLRVERITHLFGDCWNVNAPALRRVERLFCRNERVVLHCRLADDTPLILVAVAAVLVSSVRLGFPGAPADLRSASGRALEVDASLRRGEEMGWFEQGSTIIVLASAVRDWPPDLAPGQRIAAGQILLDH